MKNSILCIAVIVAFSSCIKVKQIGNLNMVSTRNVSPTLEYKQISSYANSSAKDLKKSHAKSIEDAINETIKKTPGGEFLMNVKIYQIVNKNNNRKYYAVSGDVWGLKEGGNFKGFQVNDKVIYKKIKTAKQAKIIALKDDKSCFIQIEGEEKAFEVPYSDLTKAQ